MSSIDLSSLMQQVEAAMSAADHGSAPTGDVALDATLADFRQDPDDRRPIDVMNWWN